MVSPYTTSRAAAISAVIACFVKLFKMVRDAKQVLQQAVG